MWKAIVGLCLFGVLCIAGIANAQSSDAEPIPGLAIATLHLRSGPGPNYNIIQTFPSGTLVTLVERNRSGTWLLASVNGQQGWLSYMLVNEEARINDLPVADIEDSVKVSRSDSLDVVAPRISNTVRQIYRAGQGIGNRPGVFSKVGDSITASSLFLMPFGEGNVVLDRYAYLSPAVEFFSRVRIDDETSFTAASLAARGGWTTADILDPRHSPPNVCLSGETPLECEYRLRRPSIALIMVGTNDVPTIDASRYADNLNEIIQITVDMGVIPVLSTIPDQPGSRNEERVLEFNRIIRQTASTHDIPLWNYWQAMQGLPNQGLSSDNIHPSYSPAALGTANFTPEGLLYGYNLRNLTALIMLDAIWRQVMQ